MGDKNIYYSDKYYDDVYEYRYVYQSDVSLFYMPWYADTVTNILFRP